MKMMYRDVPSLGLKEPGFGVVTSPLEASHSGSNIDPMNLIGEFEEERE